MATWLSRFSRPVFVVTGGVLLAAAILKGIQFVNEHIDENATLPNQSLAILAISLEVILGAWLWTGFFPLTARTVSVICFLNFCVVSVRQAVIGRSTCGCFGQVQITPWLTATFDLIAAIVLGVVPPSAGRTSRPIAWGLAGLIGVIASILTSWLLSPNPDLARYLVSPAIVDLGVVHQANRAEVEIRLLNASRDEMRLQSFETSCQCLSVRPNEAILAPGQSIDVAVILDLAKEPNFVGTLGMLVKGHSPDGKIVSQFTVTAKVRNR